MYQHWQDLIQTASCMKFHLLSARLANEHLEANSYICLLYLLTENIPSTIINNQKNTTLQNNNLSLKTTTVPSVL